MISWVRVALSRSSSTSIAFFGLVKSIETEYPFGATRYANLQFSVSNYSKCSAKIKVDQLRDDLRSCKYPVRSDRDPDRVGPSSVVKPSAEPLQREAVEGHVHRHKRGRDWQKRECPESFRERSSWMKSSSDSGSSPRATSSCGDTLRSTPPEDPGNSAISRRRASIWPRIS